MKYEVRDHPSAPPALVSGKESAGRTLLHMGWHDLLFLHWSLPPEEVAARLPKGLVPDLYEDQAWVGIIPFAMRGVRPAGLPAVPAWSNFYEINLRTYVRDEQGRPGVYFFSLDADGRLGVWIARTFFHLNYRVGRLEREERTGGGWEYRHWTRPHEREPSRFVFSPKGKATVPARDEPEGLANFLVERYRLFADDRRGDLWTGTLTHEPYAMQAVELAEYSPELFARNGFAEPKGPPPSALFSRGVTVRIRTYGRVARS